MSAEDRKEPDAGPVMRGPDTADAIMVHAVIISYNNLIQSFIIVG
jgi:hypothetical protein